ncbi:hypothetical protein ACIBIZ_38440 [Nonomuraea spiralis]|uniref:hypothetical protein n=1 Tax=Nonomuraea TaxID=83681 RepID=UPI000F78925B|nr:hypothetical protein [Nonomuraea sp. WAC 01424]RSN15492.1 hypothetical protein DMB42_01195 [Nonomuraea sp. WAC 01424]
MTTRSRPRWLSTVLYWYLAASFFIGFVTKFWPGPTFFGPAYAEKFADWGWPPWMRFVVGIIMIGVALANWPPDWRDLLHPLDERSARVEPGPSVR